LTISFH